MIQCDMSPGELAVTSPSHSPDQDEAGRRRETIRASLEVFDDAITLLAVTPIDEIDPLLDRLASCDFEAEFRSHYGLSVQGYKQMRIAILVAVTLRMESASLHRAKLRGKRSRGHSLILAKIHRHLDSFPKKSSSDSNPEAIAVLTKFFDDSTRAGRAIAKEMAAPRVEVQPKRTLRRPGTITAPDRDDPEIAGNAELGPVRLSNGLGSRLGRRADRRSAIV